MYLKNIYIYIYINSKCVKNNNKPTNKQDVNAKGNKQTRYNKG